MPAPTVKRHPAAPDAVVRLDRSLAAVPVAAVTFAVGLIANVWLMAALPIVAVPVGVAEVIYGWRLRHHTVRTFRTLATVAIVVGGVIAVVAAVLAIGQPVGNFGSTDNQTVTVTTQR
jgi:hypothetical protein